MVDESGVERCEGEDGRTRKGRARNLVVGERERVADSWGLAEGNGRPANTACLEHDAVAGLALELVHLGSCGGERASRTC
jgi:hypothetical protein